MFNSIQFKLFLWVFLSFSTMLIGFNFFIYKEQKIGIFSTVDLLLKSKINFFGGLIEVYHNGKIDFEPLEEKTGFQRKPTLYDVPLSGHYYQIFFENGEPFVLSTSLGDSRMVFSLEKIEKEGQYVENLQGPAGEVLRVFAKTVKVGKTFPKTFHIQIGESLKETEIFLADLRTKMWISTPFIILLAGFGAFWIARFSLKPLKVFSQKVSEISAINLNQRLEHQNINQELQELAKSFNTTLDRLEQVFIQQEHFISNASHELRTPVSVIKSYCEIPLRRSRTPEEYKESLETIFKNIKTLEHLINKLLTLSRYEQKPFSIPNERTSIGNLLKNIGLILKPFADKKEIKMPLQQSPEAVFVYGEKTSLGEVFTNLIDNAIIYTGKGGTVETKIIEDEEEVIIEIIDTGIGIPKKALNNIFERFYRIDPARGKEMTGGFSHGQGFGLGLSIAKEIIKNHGGNIEVESEMGEGTTFRVFLRKWKD